MPALSLHSLSLCRSDGTPVLNQLTTAFSPGLTGIIGANGAGKSTLLALIAGALAPSAGHVQRTGQLRRLPQLTNPTDTIADLFGQTAALSDLRAALIGAPTQGAFEAVDWTLEERLARALAPMGLAGVDPARALGRLSGGQRTRAALAAAFFDRPDIVLLDEPGNTLDASGRRVLGDLLEGFDGICLMVSHDRALLERADAIYALSRGSGRLFGGNWSFYADEIARDEARAEAALSAAQQNLRKARAAQERAATQAARRARIGRQARASGSQPKVLTDARKDKAGAALKGAARRSARQAHRVDSAVSLAKAALPDVAKDHLSLPSTGLATRKHVLSCRDLTVMPGGRPLFRALSFDIFGPERVHVQGDNGVGKSSLLACVVGEVPPATGQADILVPWAYVDQEITQLRRSERLTTLFRKAHPNSSDRDCHAALARFGFRAETALRPADSLSGGERLRAALAIALGGPRVPQLIILDEPTNHLDIAAIETVETGLNAYDGALLVVSHDPVFLGNLGITRQISLTPAI